VRQASDQIADEIAERRRNGNRLATKEKLNAVVVCDLSRGESGDLGDALGVEQDEQPCDAVGENDGVLRQKPASKGPPPVVIAEHLSGGFVLEPGYLDAAGVAAPNRPGHESPSSGKGVAGEPFVDIVLGAGGQVLAACA
jgi:hypothetical protein